MNSGFYTVTSETRQWDLDVLDKHAKYQNINIVLDPRFGPLDKQFTKWRKKFMQYLLDDKDKAFMKKVYADRKNIRVYKIPQKNAVGFFKNKEELEKTGVRTIPGIIG